MDGARQSGLPAVVVGHPGGFSAVPRGRPEPGDPGGVGIQAVSTFCRGERWKSEQADEIDRIFLNIDVRLTRIGDRILVAQVAKDVRQDLQDCTDATSN